MTTHPPRWKKSTKSNHQANCVEVAHLGDRTGTRDSKNPTGPVLIFDTTRWKAFLGSV